MLLEEDLVCGGVSFHPPCTSRVGEGIRVRVTGRRPASPAAKKYPTAGRFNAFSLSAAFTDWARLAKDRARRHKRTLAALALRAPNRHTDANPFVVRNVQGGWNETPPQTKTPPAAS